MTYDAHSATDPNADRRKRRGTWPWFVINVLLFPASAHLTLLRIRDTNFGKNFKHLVITLGLFLVLLAAGALQVAVPGVGSWWMLLPIFSALVVLYAYRRLKATFKPFDITLVTKTHLKFVLFSVAAFTFVSILPEIDMIQLSLPTPEGFKNWVGEAPFWVDVSILVAALVVMIGGYVTNTTAPITINRAVILFACFIVFTTLLWSTVFFTYAWLKVQGSVFTQFVFVMLSALLAIDYWDASTFGQYTRRFFFLSLTKGFSFVYLWLCFVGLPQQGATALAEHYYENNRPTTLPGFERYLVFTHRDRFESGHKAARRLRAGYATAFTGGERERLQELDDLLGDTTGRIFPADDHISQLKEWAQAHQPNGGAEVFRRVPLFKPIHTDWDVMLTALLVQDVIAQDRLNEIVADFKTMLPESSKGRLPDISLPHKARYIAAATGSQVDFVPPQFELLETLIKQGIHPVLSIYLAGNAYWAALIEIDAADGLAWFRLETPSGTMKAIQTCFDANEGQTYRQEILSRVMMPLPIATFRNYLAINSRPVVVFTTKGLATELPELFTAEDLTAMHAAVAAIANPVPLMASDIVASEDNPFARHVAYTRVVAAIRKMLYPARYDAKLFDFSKTNTAVPTGTERFTAIEALIDRIGGLRDVDRVEIANEMVRHNHVRAAPALFLRLAGGNQIVSDLADCSNAKRIGRELLLLGHYEAAYRYLNIPFLRHPFATEYDLWRHIAAEKLNNPPEPFLSPPEHEPHLQLYYLTLADIRNGKQAAAQKRLEAALKKDSHDSLAVHLMSKYFDQPLNERQYFPAQKGL